MVVLVQLIPGSLYYCICPQSSAHRMFQSCMTFRIIVEWGRYPWSKCPIWIHPSIPTGLQGEVDRDSCIRVIVRWMEENFRHRLFAQSMLIEVLCFVFESKYSGGKTPLIIVCWACRLWLGPSMMDFQVSPREGTDADFEALRSILKRASGGQDDSEYKDLRTTSPSSTKRWKRVDLYFSSAS